MTSTASIDEIHETMEHDKKMNSERARKNGLQAVEMLRTFLTRMGLDPKEETYPEVTAFRMMVEGPTPKVIARILVDKERFTVHYFFDRSAPPELRTKVAEFITRVNYGLVGGNLEMSFSDGTLRFKSSIDFTSIELAEVLVRNAMLSAMEDLETIAGPLWGVLDGDLEPEVAAAAIRVNAPGEPLNQ